MSCKSFVTETLDAISAVRVCRLRGSSSGYPGVFWRIQMPDKTMRTYCTAFLLFFVTALFATYGYGQNQSGFTGNNSAPAPSVPGQPKQEGYDPLLDLPPLQNHRVTLMGGIVLRTDEVMNKMAFRPFGTKQKLEVHFDTRTHFYLDGKPITEREIKEGQRIYLDTMLDRDRVFAKSIWIRTTAESGVGRGQIMDFDAGRRIVTVRDQLSNMPVKLQLTPTTIVRKGNQAGSESDLVEGALVSVDFGTQRDLRTITVLAAPGSTFTFAGRITYLDLSQKLVAVDNRSDGKKYDISVDAIAPSILHQLREGQNVTITTVFDGTRYSARNLDVEHTNSAQQNP